MWKKQQTDRTRQLLLGADRARQRTELEMLDGTDIVREVVAVGARHEAAGAGPEAELGPAAEDGESGEDAGWVDWDDQRRRQTDGTHATYKPCGCKHPLRISQKPVSRASNQDKLTTPCAQEST